MVKIRKLNVPEHQSKETKVSEKMEKVTAVKKGELGKNLEHMMPAKQAINHMKDNELLPIQSGEIVLFKAKKGFGFIRPDDLGRNNIFMKDSERIFEQGEKVNYIEVNLEAIPTYKGQIKLISGKNGYVKIIVVTPDDGGDDVVLKMDPRFPHNEIEGHGNIADRSRPEYIFNEALHQWDEVEFVANEQKNIVAIKKIEK